MYKPENGNGIPDWAEIKLALDWHSGFSLFFVFTKRPGSAQALACCIDAYFGENDVKIRHIRPEPVDESKTISTVYKVFSEPTALFLDLTNIHALSQAMDACALIMSTLNKRRSQLERDINKPIFVAMPVAMAPHLVSWAPDLWTVREKIVVLE